MGTRRPARARAAAAFGGRTEKQWQSHVEKLARLGGWAVYHTHDSRRSEAGYPDLTLVRASRLLFSELKTDEPDSQPSEEQIEWLDRLSATPAEVYLWRPSHLDEVAKILGPRPPRNPKTAWSNHAT